MRAQWLPAILVLGCAAAPAAAAEEDLNCASPRAQMEMNLCEQANFAKADAELNRVYGRLAANAGPAEKKLLRDAERAWIAYRDNECEFETSGSVGGSIHPMEVAQCLTALTNRRIRELQAQIDCSDGDLCGGQ